MRTHRTPLGYRLLAVLALLIGAGGLSLALSAGRVGSFVLALVFLPAAYGLWTGADWGGLAGIVAYGPVGTTVTIVREGWDPLALAVAVALVVAVVGYLLSRERTRGTIVAELAG